MEEKKLEIVEPEILSTQEAKTRQAEMSRQGESLHFEFKTKRFPIGLALIAIPVAVLVLLKLMVLLTLAIVFGFAGFTVWMVFRFANRRREGKRKMRADGR